MFFLLVNISDGKSYTPDSKNRFSIAKPAVSVTSNQDCRAKLEEWNAELKNDPNGIINKDEVGDYMKCLESLIPSIDYKNNMHDYYFLLDCLTNLMDYYDLVQHDENTLNEIEDLIYDISAD